MKKVLASIVIGLTALFGLSTTFAGEGALYDPVAPDGAAFVRIVNLTGQTQEGIALANKTFPEVEPFNVGDYLFFTEYSIEGTIKGSPQKFILKADTRYTLVINASSTTLIEDPAPGKRTKAMIIAYNLAPDEKVDFKTADGKASVLTGISTGKNDHREINAVKIDFGFFSASKRLGETGKKIALKRGSGYSAFLIGNQDGYRMIWAENKDNTRI
ncbi:alginate O-acetyl transferase AlgF [Oleiphilus messinensis]|uniref:Alginate biosynthesis protein AlgF n=1 Tax=Oleiphilus messinensis TaxID=141451 RepID=A0A1Y0IDG4_9GAMM|nr:alginate O-acetyltransferase AlgF [Oleiphilus messinensis]ARU58481.1 alginate O-acetyl transferase AlgF [Oleiphilus messinensis]